MLAASSTCRAPGSSRCRRDWSMASTVSGGSSPRPSATPRMSSSRKRALPAACSTSRCTTASGTCGPSTSLHQPRAGLAAQPPAAAPPAGAAPRAPGRAPSPRAAPAPAPCSGCSASSRSTSSTSFTVRRIAPVQILQHQQHRAAGRTRRGGRSPGPGSPGRSSAADLRAPRAAGGCPRRGRGCRTARPGTPRRPGAARAAGSGRGAGSWCAAGLQGLAIHHAAQPPHAPGRAGHRRSPRSSGLRAPAAPAAVALAAPGGGGTRGAAGTCPCPRAPSPARPARRSSSTQVVKASSSRASSCSRPTQGVGCPAAGGTRPALQVLAEQQEQARAGVLSSWKPGPSSPAVTSSSSTAGGGRACPLQLAQQLAGAVHGLAHGQVRASEAQARGEHHRGSRASAP